MKGCALPVLDSIIFDMDGLLIDTEIISYQLYSALLAPYGFTVSLHDYAETLFRNGGTQLVSRQET